MKRLLTTLVIVTGLFGSGGAVWAAAEPLPSSLDDRLAGTTGVSLHVECVVSPISGGA